MMKRFKNPEEQTMVVMKRVPGYGEGLFKRTKSFALTIIRLYSSLPKDTLSQTLGRQAMRSGTSVGAHYREGSRARSSAEFIGRLEVALQELEETCYWHELMSETGVVEADAVAEILDEADELNGSLWRRSRRPRRDENERIYSSFIIHHSSLQ